MLNLTTGENVNLPWCQSISRSYEQHQQFKNPSLFLGFDPRRNEYKVLFNRWKQVALVQKVKCNVLTLGTKSWRKVPNDKQFDLRFGKLKMGTNRVNGRIYWKDRLFNNCQRVIQLFNVQKEKFGVYILPQRWGKELFNGLKLDHL